MRVNRIKFEISVAKNLLDEKERWLYIVPRECLSRWTNRNPKKKYRKKAKKIWIEELDLEKLTYVIATLLKVFHNILLQGLIN